MTLVNSSGQVGQASVLGSFVGILIMRMCVRNIVRVVEKKYSESGSVMISIIQRAVHNRVRHYK